MMQMKVKKRWSLSPAQRNLPKNPGRRKPANQRRKLSLVMLRVIMMRVIAQMKKRKRHVIRILPIS